MRRLLRVGTGLLFLLTLALSALSPVIVHAAGNTCTWTGSGTDNNWSTTANWSGCGGVAPNNTDSLVFPDGASRKTNTNDLTSLSLVEVTVGGNYDISGNALTVTDGMTIDVTAATTHFRPQITFGPHSGGSSSTTVTVINPNDNIAFLDSDIVLATGANNFEVTIDDFTYFTGTISGTTNQFKITSATTPTGYTSSSLGNNHSFTATGGVVLDSVLAWCSGNTCFGNTSNTVTVTGTHANVVATTDSTWENNFICNTNVQCIYTNTMDVDVVMNGDITMQANTIIGTQGDPSMSVTLNGVISGGHNLSLGVGRVTVTGVNTH